MLTHGYGLKHSYLMLINLKLILGSIDVILIGTITPSGPGSNENIDMYP